MPFNSVIIPVFLGKGDTPELTTMAEQAEKQGLIVGPDCNAVLDILRSRGIDLFAGGHTFAVHGGILELCVSGFTRNALNHGNSVVVDLFHCRKFQDVAGPGDAAAITNRFYAFSNSLGIDINTCPLLTILPISQA